MHLGNDALTPECAVIAFGAAAGGMGISAIAIRRSGLTSDRLLLATAMGTLIFAAQAINVPVMSGVSAHLVGGVLLAAVLGPGLGAWTMALVLLLQALLLGDGGLLALGANIVNMALVPAGLVAAVPLADVPAGSRLRCATRGAAAALAVVIAAAFIVIQTAAFRPANALDGWSRFAAAMIGTHLWIGALEGLLTAAVMAGLAWLAVRVEDRESLRPRLAYVLAAALMLFAMTLFSSPLPDGYEAAAQASGMQWLLGE